MSDREEKRKPKQAVVSAEAVGTLVWLLSNPGVERRRYAIVNRLREARDRDEFATLPGDLRERVHKIIANQER